MNKKRILIATFLTLIMVGSAFAIFGTGVGVAGNNKSVNAFSPETAGSSLSVKGLAQAQTTSSTPWQFPTDNATTEPGYTGGVFNIGQIGNCILFRVYRSGYKNCRYFFIEKPFNLLSA